jgi:glucosamine--fructose-6-phosphate aminotransferase (isomerizing)
MCGIVGYVGTDEAGPLILEGLARLEYRGYDSAGIAVLSPSGELQLHKDVGKLEGLRNRLNGSMPRGSFGIGHTRWATHGGATILNAHPHTDTSGDVVVIHNGIVENYRELKAELIGRGHMYRSETDTEVIPHLIAEGVNAGLDLEHATRAAMSRIRGAAAVLAIRKQEPGVLIAARVANAGGVVIGYGEGAMHVASDLPAILGHAARVVFLEDGDVARITAEGATYSRITGEVIAKEPQDVPLEAFDVSKGLFDHYLEKEIYEQPDAILDTIREAAELDPPALNLRDLKLTDAQLQKINRVILVGMGTSYHACMVGRTYIEQLGGVTAEVDNASEFRYRKPIIDDHTLVIAVGQSGESVDTLAAMELARQRGATLVTICNTPGSQATRMADGTVFMRCGPEIAVASTKTLVGSIVALYLLAARIGEARGFLDAEALAGVIADLSLAPQILGEALKSEAEARAVAEEFFAFEHFLFLGRGLQYAVAMEGALKLKEVSYIHAEGYAAAEMKHGPISLIDNRMPVVAIAPKDEHYDKMLSNVAEVRAREGIIIALASHDDHEIEERAQFVIRIPEAPALLWPLATVVPLQFLAYHIARLRGADIDQPRNLAKTVTVE